MQIPQLTIDNIRDRVDIAEVVGEYLDLKRSGSNYKGLCPFHDERTPSFNVNAERQIFHCFGCGKGGNAFTFLMEIEGVSFPEAVRALGERCGVEVEDRRVAVEEQNRNDLLYEANTFAARFYHAQLMDARAGAVARRYLEARGIPAESWRRFGLGFAVDAWDRLVRAAREKRIGQEVLAELRLIAARENANGYYDYFRNRVMFPIIMPGGRVLGFGARTMGDDEPKYLNSAESSLFQKRRTFYGLDRARAPIRNRRAAVLVEGYTDLISVHLAGIDHAIATCGTAVTPDHAIALRRLTQRATLMPDGDGAGQNAAVTAGSILLAAGLDVSVARLAAGEDPDTAVRQRGAAYVAALVEKPTSYFDFVALTLKERGGSPREKEAIVRRVLDGFSQSDDPVRLDILTGELGAALKMDPRGLRAARKTTRGPQAAVVGKPALQKGTEAPDPVRSATERMALRLLMEGTPSALDAMDRLDEEDFAGEDHRNLYNLLDSARESRIDIASPGFQRRAEDAGLEGLAAEIALTSIPPGNVEHLLNDAIRRIKQLKIRDELTSLRVRLRELPSESEEAVRVAEYYQRLKQALVEL